jgi:hypothetical protein
MEDLEARKQAAAKLFETLKGESTRPASKRRGKALVRATSLAAMFYIDARHGAETKQNLMKSNEK